MLSIVTRQLFVNAVEIECFLQFHKVDNTLSTKGPFLNMFKNLQKIASFAQLPFKSTNICLVAIKFPILVKISATVIETLTFDKWSSKVHRFQKHLRSMKLTLTSSSTAHHARVAVEMLSRDAPGFISPLQLQWPPNNPISTQWTMQFGVNCRASAACESVTSTTSLSDWRSGPDLTARSSVLQLACLRACVKANGGYFEQLIKY